MNQIALLSSLFVMLKIKIIFEECDGTKLLAMIFYVNQFTKERIEQYIYLEKYFYLCDVKVYV